MVQEGEHSQHSAVAGHWTAAGESIPKAAAPAEQGDLDRIALATRSTLGEEGYAAAFAHGRMLRLDEARALLDRPGRFVTAR